MSVIRNKVCTCKIPTTPTTSTHTHTHSGQMKEKALRLKRSQRRGYALQLIRYDARFSMHQRWFKVEADATGPPITEPSRWKSSIFGGEVLIKRLELLKSSENLKPSLQCTCTKRIVRKKICKF